MQIKEDASVVGLKLPMREALVAIESIWREHGEEAVITCGTNGEHSAGSLHYYGYAVDVRTHYFSSVVQTIILKKLQDIALQSLKIRKN